MGISITLPSVQHRLDQPVIVESGDLRFGRLRLHFSSAVGTMKILFRGEFDFSVSSWEEEGRRKNRKKVTGANATSASLGPIGLGPDGFEARYCCENPIVGEAYG
ncbi:hypothetical protein CRG98_010845 [Punica granatum]|uniref:Uncharacterized protein n=1 Tax=Punica granatum TaxID=22663 RepID=A0A2I0KJX2_PUNGR|nr:hypothetical protein CRG98_010845 [Punica granatum]